MSLKAKKTDYLYQNWFYMKLYILSKFVCALLKWMTLCWEKKGDVMSPYFQPYLKFNNIKFVLL